MLGGRPSSASPIRPQSAKARMDYVARQSPVRKKPVNAGLARNSPFARSARFGPRVQWTPSSASPGAGHTEVVADADGLPRSGETLAGETLAERRLNGTQPTTLRIPLPADSSKQKGSSPGTPGTLSSAFAVAPKDLSPSNFYSTPPSPVKALDTSSTSISAAGTATRRQGSRPPPLTIARLGGGAAASRPSSAGPMGRAGSASRPGTARPASLDEILPVSKQGSKEARKAGDRSYSPTLNRMVTKRKAAPPKIDVLILEDKKGGGGGGAGGGEEEDGGWGEFGKVAPPSPSSEFLAADLDGAVMRAKARQQAEEAAKGFDAGRIHFLKMRPKSSTGGLQAPFTHDADLNGCLRRREIFMAVLPATCERFLAISPKCVLFPASRSSVGLVPEGGQKRQQAPLGEDVSPTHSRQAAASSPPLHYSSGSASPPPAADPFRSMASRVAMLEQQGRAVFAAADKSGNKSLSKKECKHAITGDPTLMDHFGFHTMEEFGLWFDSVDTDHEGTVHEHDLQEWLLRHYEDTSRHHAIKAQPPAAPAPPWGRAEEAEGGGGRQCGRREEKGRRVFNNESGRGWLATGIEGNPSSHNAIDTLEAAQKRAHFQRGD